MIRPSTKLLVAVFVLGCAGGAALRESGVRTARAQGAPEKMHPVPPPSGPTFEYRLIEVGGRENLDDREAILNRMGQDGWRFAGYIPGHSQWLQHLVFEHVSGLVPPPPPPPPPPPAVTPTPGH